MAIKESKKIDIYCNAKGLCAYCGTFVRPNEITNLCLCCKNCNQSKGMLSKNDILKFSKVLYSVTNNIQNGKLQDFLAYAKRVSNNILEEEKLIEYLKNI